MFLFVANREFESLEHTNLATLLKYCNVTNMLQSLCIILVNELLVKWLQKTRVDRCYTDISHRLLISCFKGLMFCFYVYKNRRQLLNSVTVFVWGCSLAVGLCHHLCFPSQALHVLSQILCSHLLWLLYTTWPSFCIYCPCEIMFIWLLTCVSCLQVLQHDFHITSEDEITE
jgi:hypothetical protein